jgi:tetratricopeptide (TPR) repeat protein
MNVRIISFLLVISFLAGGCSSSLKSSWKNFNAYYNTYYNAQRSYSIGLDKNLSQSRDYNPLQPIRVHERPVNAGAQDFENAIQKGANILRRHDESKWVDDALGLIGKSYYFRQDYFSAEQKFRELYITTNATEMRQEAVIWRGRVLLDLELHSEGIAYLSEQLNTLEGQWKPDKRAEAKTVLAQHYVNQENWSMAAEELAQALPGLKSKAYKERGYFLLGQVYENLEETELAFEAYDQVQNYYMEYQVQYLAQRKKAEVARMLGQNELAYSIFNDMLRDDKNMDYRSELDYELARTEHDRGNYTRAEGMYKAVLRNNLVKPSSEIAAMTYNGLAEIYQEEYEDYRMAASYYDSAAQQNADPDRLPENFEASVLAESFGEYARIKEEIAHQDSLLHLGRLSPQEFDSALAVIRQNRINEIRMLREEQQQQQNQMVNVNQQQEEQSVIDVSNGFLNSNNPAMQQSMKQQFYAIWGDRPLADNWRVQSMIRATSDASNSVAETTQGDVDVEEEVINVQIDISNIPFDAQEQDSVQQLIYSKQYELGTLFYLSLDMPDSAARYFERVIDASENEEIIKVSLYSLSELYESVGNTPKAREAARELIERYPDSNYAEWVAEQFDLPLLRTVQTEVITPIQLYRNITIDDTLTHFKKAQKLYTFALENRSEDIAPRAQYESIQLYIRSGKEDSVYQSRIAGWNTFNKEWQVQEADFSALKDSAATMLQDTTLTDSLRSKFQFIADSTFEAPDQEDIFPYLGVSWDSARVAIDSFMVVFNDSDLRSRVEKLNEMIDLPEQELAEDSVVVEMEEIDTEQETEGAEESQEGEITENGYLSCTEIEQELQIREERERFMAYFNFPEDMEPMELTYQFQVNQRGIPENYTLQTEDIPEDIQAEVERVFEEYLSFEPILREGQAISVQCLYTLQIP